MRASIICSYLLHQIQINIEEPVHARYLVPVRSLLEVRLTCPVTFFRGLAAKRQIEQWGMAAGTGATTQDHGMLELRSQNLQEMSLPPLRTEADCVQL